MIGENELGSLMKKSRESDTFAIATVLVERCYPSAHVVGDKNDQANNSHMLKDHPVNFRTFQFCQMPAKYDDQRDPPADAYKDCR